MLRAVLDDPDLWSTCSFAGGKNDPSDRDVVATALREATEELGINVATECVWGILKPLNDVVSLSHVDETASCAHPSPGPLGENLIYLFMF